MITKQVPFSPPLHPVASSLKRMLASGVVGLLVAACGSASTNASTTSSHRPENTNPSGRTVMSSATSSGTDFAFDGFAMTIPGTWNSTTSQNPGNNAAILTAASSPVVPGDGGLSKASQVNLGPNDVLISITEQVTPYDLSGWQQMTSVPQVDRSEIVGYAVPAPAMIIQAYQASGRYFSVGVAFGQQDPTDAQFDLANQILATFTVSPRQ